jgi:hypothetical protein
VILAGTIDGEKSSVALFERAGGALRLLRSATVDNDDFPALRPVLRRFLAQDLAALRAGCLGLGDPPPWPVIASDAAAALGLPEVELIGEAVACAEWLATLGPEDLEPLDAASAGPVGEGIWIGLGERPGLARLSRGENGPRAAPLDGLGVEQAAAIRAGLRAGSLQPLLSLLAWLARSLGPEASLYLGGDGLLPDAGRLRAALQGGTVPVVRVAKSPLPLWGTAWRAARRERAEEA